MKTIQEWAEYYYGKGIYLWMPNSIKEVNEWKFPIKQSLEDVHAFNWKESNKIHGVAGKRDIIVVSLTVKGMDENKKDRLLLNVLKLLNLNRYPWIIYSSDAISIILKCHGIKKKNIDYNNGFSVLYEGVFSLPSSIDTDKFFYNAIPIINPSAVKVSLLESCIDILKKNYLIFDSFVFPESKWILDFTTLGEGIIGAHQKGYDIWNPDDKIPNFKYAFIDLFTGKVLFELGTDEWIVSGFMGGSARIKNLKSTYALFKDGKRIDLNKCKKGRALCIIDEEEGWNPYLDEYNEEEADNFYGATDGMEGDLW